MTGTLLSRIGRAVGRSALLSHAVEIHIAGERFRADSTSCRNGDKYVDYDYAWLAALATGRARILDVGAGIGFTTLLFTRRMKPDGRCVLVDLSRSNLVCTARNLCRAGVADRTELAYARIASRPGPDEGRSATLAVPVFRTARDAIAGMRRVSGDARETTIDALCDDRAFQPELIKIDVEGAEQDALAGAVLTVDRCQPLIQVELHSFAPMTTYENARATLAWCSERGYAMWYLAKGTRVADPDELSLRGRCHVLLVPRDDEYPAELCGIAEESDVIRASHES